MDERRAQLIEHGLELFGTRPYDEVSIDDIAARANVSKGLLYHYFGGKRAFYLEVVRDAARALLDATEPSPEHPPVVRGLLGVQRYVEFVENNAPQYAALVTGGLGADPEVAGIIEEARMAFVGRLLLEIGLTEPRPIFRTALRGFIGHVEATAFEWLAKRDLPREQLVQLILMNLRATVAIAAHLDPDAGIDLEGHDFPVVGPELALPKSDLAALDPDPDLGPAD